MGSNDKASGVREMRITNRSYVVCVAADNGAHVCFVDERGCGISLVPRASRKNQEFRFFERDKISTFLDAFCWLFGAKVRLVKNPSDKMLEKLQLKRHSGLQIYRIC